MFNCVHCTQIWVYLSGGVYCLHKYLLTVDTITTKKIIIHILKQRKGDSMNRKVNKVHDASNVPFLTDMGHSISFYFNSLLPSTSAFFKFSSYNRALYTIKPSLTPPPRQLPVSDLETQVICHQRGELEETASPAWELHTGPDSSQCCSTESLNIVKQSSSSRRGGETGMEKWCQCVSDCVTVLFPHCVFCEGCVCVWAYMGSPVFSEDEA